MKERFNLKNLLSILIGGVLGTALVICGELNRTPVTTIKADTKPCKTYIVTAEEPEEPEQIKTRDDVAIDIDTQEWLIDYCYGLNISPYLIMAICESESDCNPQAIGDNGDSIGIMQIQPKWHYERMANLNVNDLTDTKGNIMVGIDYLLELFNKNQELSWVLMAYNGGEAYANRLTDKGVISEYATKVINRSTELESR